MLHIQGNGRFCAPLLKNLLLILKFELRQQGLLSYWKRLPIVYILANRRDCSQIAVVQTQGSS